ncbi:esterase-like activity of phytase family protein [Martelella soudanensis]|uniref:esterase-like activity of phytase family protein n=1 Tax=unclassified Martelella TaxID=2629616 RepID=UPI001FEE3E4C|nr:MULTISPECIES: esterase-like activity of phytase family protein [unclassified Martelella]
MIRALLLALTLFSAHASAADVSVTRIENFASDPAITRFGQLEFVGGLRLSGLHSMSSIRFLPGGQRFIAVADDGHWIDGNIERDRAGRLSGVADVTVTPMKNTRGVHAEKAAMDAESMTIKGDRILVGFEGKHRIDQYPLQGHDSATAKPGPNFLIPVSELRANGSLEALATNAEGRTVVITEKSVDADGNLFAATISGPDTGIFKVVKRQDFDVTDAAFLPDGDLLLLERRFSLLAGIGMRIRRIAADDIRPGAVVDGSVVMQASGANRIDNMEGLDIVPMPDGSLHLIIVSDDNDSMLQETLMLEFRLAK